MGKPLPRLESFSRVTDNIIEKIVIRVAHP